MRTLTRRPGPQVTRFIAQRAITLAYVAGILLLATGLTLAHRVRNYNSDDTGQQTILGIWQQGFRLQAFVPVDNYVLKLPLYALVDVFVSGPRAALLVTTLAVNLMAYTLFALGVGYFWTHFARPDSAVPWLALVWLPVLGYGFYDIIINPNTRNLEIGLAFLSLAPFAQYLRSGLRRSPVRSALIVGIALMLIGLFIYHTAYYLIFFLVPLGVLLLLGMVVSGIDPRRLRLLLFLAASLVVSQGWRLIFHTLGWVTVGESVEFTTTDRIGTHLRLLLEGTLTVFGANLLGRDVVSVDAVRSLAQLALLVPIFVYPWYLLRTYRISDQLWRFYFALLPCFVAIVFVATNYVTDTESRRYLVLLPFAAAMTIGFLYADLRHARLRALVAITLVVNVVLSLLNIEPPIDSDQKPNAENGEVIALVHSLGLDKGYTEYWLSNINTYLSGDDVNFIQVVCVNERLRPYRWLTDVGILTKPAVRTFYLYDARRADIAACDIEVLERQLGPPTDVIDVNESVSLAIYDYDIASAFDER